MSTNYSLYQYQYDLHYVVIVHNESKVGWKCFPGDVANQLIDVIPHGWSVRHHSRFLGPLLAHFDTLENLYSDYPELFI